MSVVEKEVLNAALSLDEEARLRLASALLNSLEQAVPEKIDQAWLKLANDRLDAYRRGELLALPGDETLDELQREFRKRNSA